jgi:hypothetical protein
MGGTRGLMMTMLMPKMLPRTHVYDMICNVDDMLNDMI